MARADADAPRMAVNCLYVAAASTAASAAALQWWASSLLDAPRDGDGGDRLETVLRSHVTVALLANLAAHVFVVLVLALKVTPRLPLRRIVLSFSWGASSVRLMLSWHRMRGCWVLSLRSRGLIELIDVGCAFSWPIALATCVLFVAVVVDLKP